MIKRGDLLVVKSKSLAGRVIRWFTKSWANHVAVVYDQASVIEADPKSGVNFSYLKKYNDTTRYEVRIFRFKDSEAIEQFMEALLTKLGRKYDWLHIASIVLRKVFNLRMDSKNMSICSEVVYEAAKESGIPVPNIQKVDFTPASVLAWDQLKEVR